MTAIETELIERLINTKIRKQEVVKRLYDKRKGNKTVVCDGESINIRLNNNSRSSK